MRNSLPKPPTLPAPRVFTEADRYRVTLEINVRPPESPCDMVHPQLIGFFPWDVASRVVANMDACGLASALNFKPATGHGRVVMSDMLHAPGGEPASVCGPWDTVGLRYFEFIPRGNGESV